MLRLTLIFSYCRVLRAVWRFRVVCCKVRSSEVGECGHCPLQIRRWTKDVKGPFAAVLVLTSGPWSISCLHCTAAVLLKVQQYLTDCPDEKLSTNSATAATAICHMQLF